MIRLISAGNLHFLRHTTTRPSYFAFLAPQKFRTCFGTIFLYVLTSFTLTTLQQSLTPLQHIFPSSLKIACVPRVSHFSWMSCKIHEHTNFPFGVTSADSLHVTHIPLVHADKQIETAIVGTTHLAGRLSFTGNIMLGQFPSSRRVDSIANLFRRGGSRLDIVVVGKTCFLDQMFHHELCHRTATDVTVADK